MDTPTEYAVFFTGPDQGPAFRRVTGLEEAVQVVEHLRNELGVLDANVHALTEVPLAFRTYYRVEVPGAGEPPVVPGATSASDASDLSDAVSAVLSASTVSTVDFDGYESAAEPLVPDLPVRVAFAADGSDAVDGPEDAGEPAYAAVVGFDDGLEQHGLQQQGVEAGVDGDAESDDLPYVPLGRGRGESAERSGRMGFFAR